MTFVFKNEFQLKLALQSDYPVSFEVTTLHIDER